MKLLLLDDEPILRQGLRDKIKGLSLSLEIAGEAGNGIDGLELVRRLRPDAVVTDIRMPGMDGLDFIREASQFDDRIRFIIVSGYEDFDYAKRAMQYGVANYLLKPVDDEELKLSLIQVLDLKDQDLKRRNLIDELESAKRLGMEKVRDQTLTKWIQQNHEQGPTDAWNDADLIQLRMRYRYYVVVVILLKPFSLPHYSFGTRDRELVWYAVKNMIHDQARAAGEGVLFHHAADENELICVLGLDTRDAALSVRKKMDNILFGILSYLRLEASIAIGTGVEGLENAPQSYQAAKQELRNRIMHGSNRIYQHTREWKTGDRNSLITEEMKRLILQWLKDLDRDAIHCWIERRIGAIAQDSGATYAQLEWFCIDFYLLLRKYLIEQTSSGEFVLGEMDDLVQWLQKLSGWHEAIDYMKRYVSDVFGYLAQSGFSADYDILDEVKTYIQHHFAEPLSLQIIAERFYIHPNYFSRRFKEKFGEGFIDYLTGVRMSKAADWLKEDRVKIHQISEMAGFDNAAYFGTVFRKKFGMTPSQYREQYLKNKEAES